MFESLWRATIFGASFAMHDVNVVDFDRIQNPGFATMRACEAYAYKNAPHMATLVAEYMDADVSVKWTCQRWKP